MKRWHRVILITTISLLVIFLGLMGSLMWLQSSGRLTQYAQELVRERLGPYLSFDAVTFTSWNVVTLTNVRLQQTLPGWQLDIICPRLEAHYTLQGLRRKQISAVQLIQPSVHLQTREASVPSDVTNKTPVALVLPVERLQVRDATLQLERNGILYTFKPIQVAVRQLDPQRVRLEAHARFADDIANVHIQGDMALDLTHPNGTFDVSLGQIDIARLATKRLLPSHWASTLTDPRGMLDIAATQVELRGQMMQGTLKVKMEKGHGNSPTIAVQGLSVTTEMTFEANLADRTINLQGPMQLQAVKVRQVSSELAATQIAAQLPVQLVYAPGQWHIHIDLRLQGKHIELAIAGGIQLEQISHTASIDVKSAPKGWSLTGELAFEIPRASIASMQFEAINGKTPVTLHVTPKQWHSTLDVSLQSQTLSAQKTVKLHELSSQLPVDITSTSRGWSLEGTADVQAHSFQVNAAETDLSFERVQSQSPIRMTPTALTLSDVQLQTKTVRWQPGTGSAITSPLDLRTTVDLNLPQQQLKAKHLVLSLPNLGRIQGSGIWQWPTGTTRDMRLSMTPTSLKTAWPYLAPWLPLPYPTWSVSGHTQIDLHIPHAVWRGGTPTKALALSIDSRFHDVAFSSSEGNYAGENIQGRIKADVSLMPDWRPASVQGTLTLKPFALLVGSFFPELEQHRVTSTITFNTTYHPATGDIDLAIDSQVGSLGRIAIKGKVDISQPFMQVDVMCHLHQIDVGLALQTFMSETLRQATNPLDMRGRLNARLRVRGNLANAHVQGDLQLASFHLHTGPLALRNLSLQLPVDAHYPLPKQQPNLANLPASAYGQLRLAHVQLGPLQIPDMATKVAMRSDSVIFQKDIHAALLKGVMHVQDLVAYRVLRPQRQIQARMRMRSLNLQHLQRVDNAWPIAGQVDADFSRLNLQNGRLQTEGSLQIEVADGRIRLYDVGGWDLFSQIPSIQGSLKTEAPLSLRALTQIYPIGEMGGTLHFTVDDLTITAGEPAAFRLHFHVQKKGGETREISLEALNNLLFTTGSAKVASSFAEKLRYRRFGAEITLQHDTLRLRGLYKDRKGREYFMRAPALGNGVSIVNPVPENGTPFRDFVRRLTSIVLQGPDVSIK